MDFSALLKEALRLGDAATDQLGLNIQLASRIIEALNRSIPRFDEETLTGAMIGAFAGSHPLSAFAYPERDASSLQWAGYGKNDTGKMGERNTGADFTLVLEFPDGRFKIAVIQAKRDDNSNTAPGILKIGQLKEVTEKITEVIDGKAVETTRKYKRNQVEKLVTHAGTLADAHQKEAGLKHLTWVHYLCQHKNGVRAIPLSRIRARVQRSIDENRVVSLHVKESMGRRLEEMLLSALDDQSPEWLEIRAPLDEHLPARVNLTGLLTLMPVVAAEGSHAKRVLEVGDAVRSELSPVIEGASPGAAPAYRTVERRNPKAQTT